MPAFLMVCLGNICRSPLAQGCAEAAFAAAGLAGAVRIDSAGTAGYHIGEPPDERSIAVAATAGIDLTPQRGRQAQAADFAEFDLLLAMDRSNRSNLLRLPGADADKVRLFLSFAPALEMEELPDPYYGGQQGFELALTACQAASAGLVRYTRERYSL